eukprot:Tbor_TRINITY_DN6095_c1_g1::TRINITY_DN6095_c1_g1_i1::g.10365::m.10365
MSSVDVALDDHEEHTVRELLKHNCRLRYYPPVMYDVRHSEWAKSVVWPILKPYGEKGQDRLADIHWRYVIGIFWCPANPSNVLVTLSISTLVDCLLRALELPPASEVLMSGVSTPDILSIIKHHKLVTTAFDIDITHYIPDLEQCRRCISKKTKIMIISPPFGRPMKNISDLLKMARDNNIISILHYRDQSFTSGDSDCDPDIQVVGYGILNFSTAFGGAISCFKDKSLADKVLTIETALPVRSISKQIMLMMKSSALLLIDDPLSYGIFRKLFKLARHDINSVMEKYSRDFHGELIPSVRQRPHHSMLRLLYYRIRHIDHGRRERVAQSEWDILTRIPNYIQVVSAGDPATPRDSISLFFAVLVNDPLLTVAILQAHGFSAVRWSSYMQAVPTLDGETCNGIAQLMEHTVYFPIYPEISEAKRDNLIDVLHKIPRKVIQSPCSKFHDYVKSLPDGHAYRSKHVDVLLNGRKPFTELPCQLLNAFLLGPVGGVITAVGMSKM